MSRGILVRRTESSRPFILYHWSPRDRRDSIKKNGQVIGSPFVAHTAGWVADYLCFSNSPSHAWAHSGEFCARPGLWDLWMVWSSSLERIYKRSDHAGLNPAEFRVFHDVAAKSLGWVGEREYAGRRKPR